jgi:glutamate racemase
VRSRPIGVFDSGLGGLTVLQSLLDLLPGEDLIYLGDTARYPYGDRSVDELQTYSRAIASYLEAQEIKLLVVACNSATAASLDVLREEVAIPVVGVVGPGLRAAASVSRTHRAVVIGTSVTVESRVYETTAERLGLDIALSTLACPGFVELVEEGHTDGPSVMRAVRERLAPLLTSRVDTLVLGCTHFPLLGRVISEVVGRNVALVSSADETAFEVRDLLERTGWLQQREHGGSLGLLSTGDPERFRELGQRFLGVELPEVQRVGFSELGDDPFDPSPIRLSPQP